MNHREMLARATAAQGDPSEIPRVVAVFAHPDDETVALGGRIRRFRTAHFVHLTDGTPRDGYDSHAHGFASVEEYRMARRSELNAMFRTAGLAGVSQEEVGIADQQASLRLVEAVTALDTIFRERRPEVIFTHPYEGGHPDHDACAFAVHTAVAMGDTPAGEWPLIVEGAFYHAGPAGIATGRFLPASEPVEQVTYELSTEDRERKEALIECFATQAETLRYFDFEQERYRVAPRYDFHRPPHAGSVFYDSFPWGMSSGRFCELAAQAQAALEGAPVTR